MLTDPGGPLKIVAIAPQELNSKIETATTATGVKRLKNNLI